MKIEVTDLSGTFDLGIRLVIVNGKTVGWVPIPVF